MTKTQLLDSYRNIKKNFVSYISILLITMLSASTFMGVTSAAVNLENGANDFYKESDFYDLEVVSTLLLSEDDVDELRNLDSVESVAPFYYVTAGIEKDGAKENVNVITSTGDICIPELLSGEEPHNASECMIEDRLAESLSFDIGDTINLYGNDGGAVTYLPGEEYVVTGIFRSPQHIKPSVKENSYIIVSEDAFDRDALKNCWMRAYVRLKDTENENVFKNTYTEKVSRARKNFETLALTRTKVRSSEVRDIYQTDINENAELLESGKKKLEDAKASLTDAEEEIAKGKQELEDTSRELDELKDKLDSGMKTLEVSKGKLDSGKAELDEAKKTLDSSKAVLNQKSAELQNANASLAYYDSEISSKEKLIASAGEELKASGDKLDAAKAGLASARTGLEDAFRKAEDIKGNFRYTIEQIVESFITYAGIEQDINWSSNITDVDVENARIEIFSITDEYSVNLHEANIKTLADDYITGVLIPKYKDTDKYEYVNQKYTEFRQAYGTDIPWDDTNTQDTRAKLNSWSDERKKYLDNLAAYEGGLAEYNKKSAEYTSGKNETEAARARWNESKSSYEKNYRAYQDAVSKYNSSLADYNTYLAEWNRKNSEYQKGLSEYNAAAVIYNNGCDRYEDGLKKLAEYEKEFERNKEEYESGLADYEEGENTLKEMQEKLDSLEDCKWFINDIEANVGYKHMGMTVVGLRNMGNNFTILFVILASLIIYATIARLINEQHKLVGTSKAFGLYKREILSKYLVFGLSALVMGIVLGIPVHFGFQKFALVTFVKKYAIEVPAARPVLYVMLIVIIAAFAITSTAVLMATAALLKQPAVELLRESSPNGVKGESRSRLGLTLFQRLILRNVVSDKMRVLVTMMSIASCCALVNIGFSMKNNLEMTNDLEFERNIQYDYDVSYDVDSTDSSLEEADKILEKHGAEYSDCMDYYSTFKTDGGSEIVEVVVSDLSRVQNFYRFRYSAKDRELKLGKEGVYLKESYAKTYDIEVGDTITIMNSKGTEVSAAVAGTYENYFGQKLYMDSEYYETLFKEEPVMNKCMVKISGGEASGDSRALIEELEGCPYVREVVDSTADRTEVGTYFKAMNGLLVLIIFVAVLMAGIIISNLTFMYIVQKKVEIIIMRINGFSIKEVTGYLLNESIFTTFLGIFGGLLGGSLLASNILRSFQKPHLELYKGISFKAWLEATLVTLLFSIVINFIALKKVRNYKMTDIANVK
ncbi:MAG: ABC transporter permease [Eubacterium sp.]|nr:ABC transporter permease [Eubacterium sp.]